MARKKNQDGEGNEIPPEQETIPVEEGIERTDLQAALARGERVVEVQIDNQMKEAYLDYAMSVIVGRALPDVRDGLKPVHRRILFAMHERAWRQDRPFVKCAKIVGEVIGNFHPHGDSAVYDALVRMAQDFSMRVPLIDPQGNFGNIDGDNPAAYRYTEARLSRAAEELLRDIDKDTVDYNPNFDDTRKEPRVLPAAFPNLLVNGSTGIAVGMATNIPPHNISEIIDATTALIANPDLSLNDLIKIVPAPDFPTGGIIIGGEGLRSAYTTGRGSFRIRARVDIEQNKKGRDVIVITEIPYQVNKKTMLEKMGELVANKVIEGIADILDLSDRHGVRIEIELKRDVNTQVVLNQLYKQTQLQVSYGIIMLALVEGQPRVLNLKQILTEYIAHRKEVVVRRARFELDRAEKRAHVLEGLKIALDFIDEVIKIIRGSSTVDAARSGLMSRFGLSEIQANAILDMRLQKLTSLEAEKIVEELEGLKTTIKELNEVLASDVKQYEIVSNELGEIRKTYASAGKRKTEVDHGSVESASFDVIDLIADEEVVITVTEDGFIKRMPHDTFKRQRRGGKGVKSGGKREDIVKLVKLVNTHDTVLLFSNKGKVFALMAHELPVANKDSRGKSLKAIINLSSDEKITALCSFREFDNSRALIMISRDGTMKKSELDVFANARKGGIIAINLKKGDELIDVKLVRGKQDIILTSRQGQALRMDASSVRSQGRGAGGVRGMNLAKDDAIVGMDLIRPDTTLFVISEKGYGKRVDYDNFATKGRGGKGMTYLKTGDKNGLAVGICTVSNDDDVIVMSRMGATIRLEASEVPIIGRAAVGVRIVNLADGDIVKDVAMISEKKDD